MSVLKNIGMYEDGTYNFNKNVDHITSYNISNNIIKLDNHCFIDCSNLSSITIPNSVSSLGSSCFSNCTNLSSITIPNSVTCLGDNCFYNCNLKSITIPTSISRLPNYCFSNCINLNLITIPDSVTYIKKDCFYCCSSLRLIYTNNPLIKPGLYNIPLNCKILPYEQSPDLKPKQIKIEPIQIKPLHITEEYNPNLLEFNEYIKERSNLIETVHVKSVIKYHESIIDIAEELNENVKIKQFELDEYIKVLQDYKSSLNEISSNLTKKMDQHTQKLKEIEENNYKLPELNVINDKLNKIVPTVEDEDFNLTIVLNENYYHKDNLIIPKTNSPYTEIYKLPCNFSEITIENKRILSKAEKKIALLSIEYPHEYIDLSNTDIQYFIDTFKNCMNLKEIQYPDSTEYK